MTSPDIISRFYNAFSDVTAAVHKTAVEKGWWEAPLNIGEKIALMHSELSEALEAARGDYTQPSEHIGSAGFNKLEEEFADVIIRIMDVSAYMKLRVGPAIIAKMAYNTSRPHKHGGKKF